MADMVDQIEDGLITQFKIMQRHNPNVSDGVLICAMARVQGKLINFAAQEDKTVIVNNLIGIVKREAKVTEQ